MGTFKRSLGSIQRFFIRLLLIGACLLGSWAIYEFVAYPLISPYVVEPTFIFKPEDLDPTHPKAWLNIIIDEADGMAHYELLRLYIPETNSLNICPHRISFVHNVMDITPYFFEVNDPQPLELPCTESRRMLYISDAPPLSPEAFMEEFFLLPYNVHMDRITNDLRPGVVQHPYFYPFDSYKVVGTAYLQFANEPDPTAEQINRGVADLEVGVRSSIWDVKAEVTQGKEGFYNQLSIFYERSRPWKILTVALLGTIAIFIFSTIFISETGSMLEVTVGILFSLWGIREILVPEYIQRTTIVDHIVILLYLLLAFAVIIRLVIRPLWPRVTTPKPTTDPYVTESPNPPFVAPPIPQQPHTPRHISRTIVMAFSTASVAIILVLRHYFWRGRD